MSERADVIVVGAGIAGLAAARELCRAGARVTLCEASARFGGRIRTEYLEDWRRPVELGAEFVHGDPTELLGLVQEAGLTLEPVAGEHFESVGGRLELARGLSRAQRLLDGAESLLTDRSALEFATLMHVDTKTARWLMQLVEGFHGAAVDRVSARSLAKQSGAAETQYRLQEGYGALVSYLIEDLVAEGVEFALGQTITQIRTQPGGVELHSRTRSFRAAAVVLALPLSVLRAHPERGGISLDPEIADFRDGLARFEMGTVMRVVARLREPPRIFSDLPDGGFLHAPDAPFPTFWGGGDAEQSQLTAWCGGPRAAALGDERAVAAAVLASLARVSGESPAEIERSVLDLHVHDFVNDPHLRGAYPYTVPTTGHDPALKSTIAPAIAIAGDYLDADVLGTVGASVRSGYRAAEALSRAA
jgi:predicted NAD/FAD-dependent oxidoreductase